MNFILPIIFFTAVAIQLIYVLFIFTKIIGHYDFAPDEIKANQPEISIIIAAFNELENLKELLPLLAKQNYPNFEILVADDRSQDGTYDYLLQNPDKIKNLSFVRIMDLPQHFTAKKYALTMAIKKSKYETLLFTDADCRPTSDNWLATMVSQMTSEKEIVLGFSPYYTQPGRLNALIRYETFQTAVQYFSFALAKMPFMGVGRNLMYRKSLFWSQNGFASHHGLLSGDDDLFINAASNKTNVAVCLDSDTYVYSKPKETWNDWFYQKKRHLSVGKRYKFRDRFSLGLLWASQLLCWFMIIPLMFLNPDWYLAPEWSRIPNSFFQQYKIPHLAIITDWMRMLFGIFVSWIIIKWIVLAKANNRLGKTVNNWKIPLHEFLYTMYLLALGVVTMFSNPKKIKWK